MISQALNFTTGGRIEHVYTTASKSMYAVGINTAEKALWIILLHNS